MPVVDTDSLVAWARLIGWTDVRNPASAVATDDKSFTIGYFLGRDDDDLLHHVWAIRSTEFPDSWRVDSTEQLPDLEQLADPGALA